MKHFMLQMCLNPALAIHSRDKPPPLYICSDCAEVLKKDHSDYMMDILLPMSHVATKCENKVTTFETQKVENCISLKAQFKKLRYLSLLLWTTIVNSLIDYFYK